MKSVGCSLTVYADISMESSPIVFKPSDHNNEGGCPTGQGTTFSRDPYEENSRGIVGLY